MDHSEDHPIPSNPGVWPARAYRARAALDSTALPTLLTGAALLGLFLLFLGLVQFSTPNLPDNDGFYHIKLAYLMRTEGLKPDFPYLPLTILNPRQFYDHHFLYHVLLIPFTYGDLRTGAKWAAVVIAALAFLVVWRLLDRQRVPFAPLWALGLLAVSEAFIYRMSITRAQSLSLLLLALALHWLLTGRRLRLIPLGFIYVWAYNAFPLLPAVAGIYVLAVLLVERRLDLRPLLYSSIGVAAGLVINPYFPHNLVFAYQHILPKLFDATAASVGNEWYPYDTGQLLSNSPLAFGVFLSGCLALGLSGRRIDTRTAASFLLACLTGWMLFQSRRFIEYFPPFALIFAAFAWAPVLASVQFNRLLRERPRLRAAGWAAPALAALLALLVLAAGVANTFQDAKTSIARSKPYETFAGASAWLAHNTPPGSRVFQTDWDDFPRLFFYNTHNTYLVGLDPTYMQLYDPELYDRWVDITRGRVDRPSTAIRSEFGARYVVSDLDHGAFEREAERDPALVEVYRDGNAVVFEVKE